MCPKATAGADRIDTGVPGLNAHLGGGLLPGTLTVVAGATGIGKTQLGLQFARAGLAQDGKSGIVFDMTCRGDSQSHARYARRMFAWDLRAASQDGQVELEDFFAPQRIHGDYLHVFQQHGRRVTRRDLDEDDWRLWQSELATRLSATIAFFYGNFVQGVRRAVIDGIEPADIPRESIQFQLIEYIYHQIFLKESSWVARDLFRQDFRRTEPQVLAHEYDHRRLTCLVLATTREVMLDDLVGRPLDEGDILSNANTVIYMGKVREGAKLGRGVYIAKHRGSTCSEDILPCVITDQGVHVGGV